MSTSNYKIPKSRRKGARLTKSKLLVLCVDRDDDLGLKSGLATPIVGKDECLNAATKLAVADPEEADANAIFAGIKVHQELIENGHDSDVAIITGLQKGGYDSDQKLIKELQKILKNIDADEAILVSDGVDESYLIPTLQAFIPITSVRRVVIKHSGKVEETYAVLGRYLRMLVFDQRFAKFALGVPGLIFIAWSILAILGILNQAITVTLAILGISLAIRGFDLDTLARSMEKIQLSGYVKLFSTVAGALVIVLGSVVGLSSVSEAIATLNIVNPSQAVLNSAFLFGTFASSAQLLMWMGLGLLISGNALSNFITNNTQKIIRDGIAILILLFLYLPISQFSSLLIGSGDLFIFIASSIFGLAATFLTVIILYKKYSKLSKQDVKVDND